MSQGAGVPEAYTASQPGIVMDDDTRPLPLGDYAIESSATVPCPTSSRGTSGLWRTLHKPRLIRDRRCERGFTAGTRWVSGTPVTLTLDQVVRQARRFAHYSSANSIPQLITSAGCSRMMGPVGWPSGPVASARASAMPRITTHRGRHGGSTSSTTRATFGLRCTL